MYVDVPTNVSAIEFISSPETPKSQILIWPRELHKILDGLMSVVDGYAKDQHENDQSEVRPRVTSNGNRMGYEIDTREGNGNAR
jgi:hypothetical protein